MQDHFYGADFSEAVLVANLKLSRSERYLSYPTKRVFDLALALALLPVVAPLIAVFWCALGKNGLFAQDRVGRGGRVFRCYKLRTMVVNADQVLVELLASDPLSAAEWNRDQKLANDPRITRLGRFLRVTSLDELPQILNVLRGDMSIVGPRPFMVSQERMYVAAGGRSYYYMRPGITGIWQTEGRSTTSFDARIDYDDQYAKNMGFKADLALILKTAGVVLKLSGR
ncbi:sugar transferase (plasmid) [Falsihalocynthiibacter sp. SS001]|uniref:sugar transferase n=1 Tax=Falsihalocynthiibacter sp. SS001 TaxID=3349698 RepID=UPI0036D227E5